MSGDLVRAERGDLVNPLTGELVEATPENAAAVLVALREHRHRINAAVRACEEILVDESRRVGTKTLRLPGGLVARRTGGSEVMWDVERLRAGLRRAGCPQERLDALITEVVDSKVSAQVARELAAANPAYGRVIERAKAKVEKPWRINVKEG